MKERIVSVKVPSTFETRFITVPAILQRVRNHDFNPIREWLTVNRSTGEDGVANLHDEDWRVRVLAVRDLVRLGEPAIPEITSHLRDDNLHVRQVCAMVLGLLRATSAGSALQERLLEDPNPVVRSQAAISLGEIGLGLPILKVKSEDDSSRDVRHQCELAAYRIEHWVRSTSDLAAHYAALDESTFEKVKVGKPAIDFVLRDTNGNKWQLSDFRGKKKVALIWVFADWCPVCHNEFHELIELKQEFVKNELQVFTVECHDLYRCRVMVGEEFQPKYWFTKESLQKLYSEKVWWPHLVDLAGSVGATYGVQPMEYVVHSEWINRPSTIIIDEEGVVRFAYYGTYWGDRSTIQQTLDMVLTGTYEFEPPRRKGSR